MAHPIGHVFAAVFAAVLTLTSARAEGYLSALPDMPLAAGLAELPEETLVFDKPEGRIIRASATRAAGISDSAIARFYIATLPNLGWQAPKDKAARGAGDLTFTRKGENLRITFSANRIVFDLAPTP